MALNIAISFAGLILLGFIYSFSQNQLHDGIEIEPTISNTYQQPVLAKDISRSHAHENMLRELE